MTGSFEKPLTASELHATADSRVWAREFCRTLGAKIPALRDEQEWVEGWFANAMTAAETLGRRDAGPADPAEPWPYQQARYEASRPY